MLWKQKNFDDNRKRILQSRALGHRMKRRVDDIRIGFRLTLPKMEFLDINLAKDWSLSLHAIHSLFTGGFLKKTRLYSGFKNTYKKSLKQENSNSFINSVLLKEKWGWKTRQKFESEKIRVYAQKPRLKIPIKNSISGRFALHGRPLYGQWRWKQKLYLI